jgi:hypothetical protein
MRHWMELFLAFRESRETWRPQQANLGRDRRVFRRIDVKVAYRMRNRVYGVETEGQLANLSLGGVGFVAPANWAEGSPIHLVISDYGFASDGVIVFRKADGAQFFYGAKFQALSVKNLLRLRRVLKKNNDGPLTV